MTEPGGYEDDWPDDEDHDPEPDHSEWRHTVTIHPEGDRL